MTKPIKAQGRLIESSKTNHNNGVTIEKWEDGSIFYYFNGKLHRENGPAKILHVKLYIDDNNGESIRTKLIKVIEYRINGKLHREDGPALISSSPNDIREYWINNKNYSFDKYKKFFLKKISKPDYHLSKKEMKFLYKHFLSIQGN